MKQLIFSLFSTVVIGLSPVAQAEDETTSHFISEDLYTYLHSGPGNQYRILGSVTSSTPVTLLDRSSDGKYSQIRDDKDREGWVLSDSIAQGTTRSEQIARLEQQLEGFSEQLAMEKENVRKQLAQSGEWQEELEQLQQQLNQAIQQRDLMQQQLAGYQDETKMKWFMNGGMVAGGGVILGLLLSFISGKRKRKDRWM